MFMLGLFQLSHESLSISVLQFQYGRRWDDCCDRIGDNREVSQRQGGSENWLS